MEAPCGSNQSFPLCAFRFALLMKHLKKGRKFGRTRDQRLALLRTLAFQLIMNERLKTSEAKAKELKPLIEKMITLAKAGNLSSRRRLTSRLPGAAAAKMIKVIAPRFAQRPGGYTRIMKLAPRSSDSSRRAIIEFVQ